MTRRLMANSLAIVMVLAVSGCGNAVDGDPSANKDKAAPRPADRNSMNPHPRDNVRQGGAMTWAIGSVLPNFNYGQLDGTSAEGARIIEAIMPQVFLFDAGGAPRFNPDYLLAEPRVSAGPPQVVTYTLNRRAIWYDGTPISSDDYVAQWKAQNGANKAFQISGSTGYDQVASVTQGVDKFEVVVTFRTPYADWKALFTPLYPSATNSDPKVFNTGWKDRFLTSGGPFKFQSHDATAKTYTLVANEKWWGNKPKLDTLVFRAIDSDAQPSALANGEIDMMDVGPNADYYNRAKAIQGIDIRVAGGPNFRHLTLNSQSPMLQDVRVRQALAMAIDRSAIARAELGPLPVLPAPLGNHIFMQNQTGYQDNSGVVAFNPDKARQMLDQAGWKVMGATRLKDGKILSIGMIIPSGSAVSRSEAELVQNMLGQVQVRVDINAVPRGDMFDKYIIPGRFEFTVFSWLGGPFPISASQTIYRKPTGDVIQQNYGRTGTEEIDRLFQVNVQELDPEKAIARANEIDKLIWAEVHSLTTYQRPEIWAAKAGLANIGARGFASIRYEDIGWLGGKD